ncbi:hypothetical protein AC579_10027 [Pseudocercospora musae]|uniref:Peptidase S33 tripeptidyl aminopeptidase-like C-terminal domain-containing protein n=1 Tax=Pseudocercospora musae TaxID=113226 RepID=A0A139IH64_9PEZI|nr:hypothetical protein AC579_10027 [Pseudocercospora musae]KXT14034.1 hypothetical protein AC579_10027 [Pseudocercospora musae]
MRSLTLLILSAVALAAPKPNTLGPSLDEFLAESNTATTLVKRDNIIKSRQSSTNTSLPDAGVKLCTEPDFQGECDHVEWPVNTCVDLMDYAGETESFIPDDGFECLLMQGECDATTPYIEIGDSDHKAGGDLTKLSWIGKSNSYICFTELLQMRRFVRVARLRAKMKIGM